MVDCILRTGSLRLSNRPCPIRQRAVHAGSPIQPTLTRKSYFAPRCGCAQSKPFSCQKLLEARQLQKALFTYVGGPARDVATETLEDQTRSLCRFLKAYYNALSAADWMAHSMGDDVSTYPPFPGQLHWRQW